MRAATPVASKITNTDTSETPATDRALRHVDDLLASNNISEEDAHKAIDEVISTNAILPDELDIPEILGKKHMGLMWPTSFANDHDAAPLLHSYSTHGCPVDCGDPWSHDQIITALKRGAHISAKVPRARDYLLKQSHEKEKEGFVILKRWGDIKSSYHKNLKLSPVAMVPHKSRDFRVILDLSFNLLFHGKRRPSVNESTNILAPQKAMAQLGHVLRRMLYNMATHYSLRQPFKFCKVDIKDGFWRMVVNTEDAWHFCYSIPPASQDEDIDDRIIVVPSSLQMGWAESPPFFCAATETARDIIDNLVHSSETLPPHPSEHKMLVDTPIAPASMMLEHPSLNMVEVYVDDFIGGTNQLDLEHLTKFSRAILHGVHSIFPHPSVSKHSGHDPISQKKMDDGDGLWDYTKEILGWMFDGKHYTVYLPPEKTEKLRLTLKNMASLPEIDLKSFQSMAGKLNHAAFGIPNGRGLTSPIYRATHHNPELVRVTPALKQALLDWNTLLLQISTRPTHVLELSSREPAFIGFVDACKSGIGGVWLPGTHQLQPVVWRLSMPLEIQNLLKTKDNPKGTLSMNDFEMAGILLHWLVLEQIVQESLQYKTVAIFCDNSSAVSWTYKLASARSVVSSHLLRALALRLHTHRSSPLLSLTIAGVLNKMADVASRSFIDSAFTNSSHPFLHVFQHLFPLKKPHFWTEFQLPKSLSSRVMSSMLGKQLTLASWTKIPGQERNIGLTGKAIVPASTQTRSYTGTQTLNAPLSLQHLQHEFGLDVTGIAKGSKPSRSLQRSQPLPRPSNWLENRPLSTRQMRHTQQQWDGLWKDGDVEIPHPSPN